MFDNLPKLNVGDIAAYETFIREERRRELIATFKSVYGDNMPTDAVFQIDRELGRIKSIFADDDIEIDAKAVQFLLWRAIRKKNKEVTFEQIGDEMDIDKLQDYIEEIMPSPQSIGKDEKKNAATP